VRGSEKKKDEKKENVENHSGLSLHHHEDKSASPCKQQADPAQTARALFFSFFFFSVCVCVCVVTALNEKNAGQT